MELGNVKPPQIAFAPVAMSVALHFALCTRVPFQYRCLPYGVVPAAVSFGVMIWDWWFFRSFGTPISTDQRFNLVTLGPVRLSRNPMC
jgi:hypothetical protein